MTFLSAMIAFYAYDKTSGSSLKRAALAALAGSAVAVVEALVVAGIGAAVYQNMPAGTMTGLSPDHYPGVLPSHGGIPKNVYTRMPSVPNIGMAFGQL